MHAPSVPLPPSHHLARRRRRRCSPSFATPCSPAAARRFTRSTPRRFRLARSRCPWTATAPLPLSQSASVSSSSPLGTAAVDRRSYPPKPEELASFSHWSLTRIHLLTVRA